MARKMKNKENRKERALERKEVADKRTSEEQLARLDRMFGEGKGAKKEREKLHDRIAKKQVNKKIG